MVQILTWFIREWSILPWDARASSWVWSVALPESSGTACRFARRFSPQMILLRWFWICIGFASMLSDYPAFYLMKRYSDFKYIRVQLDSKSIKWSMYLTTPNGRQMKPWMKAFQSTRPLLGSWVWEVWGPWAHAALQAGRQAERSPCFCRGEQICFASTALHRYLIAAYPDGWT